MSPYFFWPVRKRLIDDRPTTSSQRVDRLLVAAYCVTDGLSFQPVTVWWTGVGCQYRTHNFIVPVKNGVQ